MDDESFREWWWAHYGRLLKYVEHDLERMQCRDSEIIATSIMEETYLYFLRICPRINDQRCAHLVQWVLHRRALNGLRDAKKRGEDPFPLDYNTLEYSGTDGGDGELYTDVSDTYGHRLANHAVLSYEEHGDPLAKLAIIQVLRQMNPKDAQLLIEVCVEEKSLDDISKERGQAHRTGPQKAIKKAKERFKRIWNSLGFKADSI